MAKEAKEPDVFEFEEEKNENSQNNQNDNKQENKNQNDNKRDDKNQNANQDDKNQNENKQNENKEDDKKQNENKEDDKKQNENKEDDKKQNENKGDDKKEDDQNVNVTSSGDNNQNEENNNLTKADEKKDEEKKEEKKEDEKKDDEKKDEKKKDEEKKDEKKEMKFTAPENKAKHEAGKELPIQLELKNVKEDDVEIRYHQIDTPDAKSVMSAVKTMKYEKDCKLKTEDMGSNKWFMMMARDKTSLTTVATPITFYLESKVKITYGPGVSDAAKQVPSDATMDLLKKVCDKIKQETLMITSTIRLPKQQAEAMYNNMERGIDIPYAAPGEAVKAVYKKCRGGIDKLSKEETIKKMVEKIEELSGKNQRVSLHCVPEDVYDKLNVLDISYTNLKVQEFINALCEEEKLSRIFHGKSEITNPAKAKYLASEPCVHIEITQ
jgi:hypothetical protein